MNCDIDPRQYTREGHSTTQALIYLLHAIHDAVDTGNCSARCESVVPCLHGATPIVVFHRELNLDLHFLLYCSNRLLGDWHSKLKYVDDTTVFEVILHNSRIACWILLLEIDIIIEWNTV